MIARYLLFGGLGGYSPFIAEEYSFRAFITMPWVLIDPISDKSLDNRVVYYLFGSYVSIFVAVALVASVARWRLMSRKSRALIIFFSFLFVTSLIPVQWSVFGYGGIQFDLDGSHFLYMPAISVFTIVVIALFEASSAHRKLRAFVIIAILSLTPLFMLALYINNRPWQETADDYKYFYTQVTDTLPNPPPGATLTFRLENDETDLKLVIYSTVEPMLEVVYGRKDVIITYIEDEQKTEEGDYNFVYDVKARSLTLLP
jgi:hypothetical protein